MPVGFLGLFGGFTDQRGARDELRSQVVHRECGSETDPCRFVVVGVVLDTVLASYYAPEFCPPGPHATHDV